MAKKKPVIEAEHPIIRIGAELTRENYAEAWKLARQLCNQALTDDHLAIARNVLKEACEHFADANRPGDFAKYYDFATSLPKGAGNDWTATLGLLQARAGYFSKAKQLLEPLNDPAMMAQAIAHVADKTITSRQAGLLPSEYQPAYAAVLAGFEHYQKGNDEAARESLNAVGLQSPYLEWKVLLRGMIAFTASDDTRAIENFARLKPERTASKIASIFRAKIDEQFRTQLPPEIAANAELKYRSFAMSVLHQCLKSIQQNLGRGKSLAPAFSAIETAIPFIKAQKPALLPRLANCLYHAILQQGHPDDMKRYRKSFGQPKEDPHFHRLQGIILEQTDQLDGALACWKNYAEWLDTPPEGWPSELTKRVQARVLFRLGSIATDLADWEEDDDGDDLFDFFAPRKKKPVAKAPRNFPDPNLFYVGAVEAAPDWEDPALEVFNRYTNAGMFEKAEIAAKAHLQHNPGSLAMLDALGTLYSKQGRAAECLEVRKKALAANPLDKTALKLVVCASIAFARRKVAEKKYEAADAALREATELNGGIPILGDLVLRAAIAHKLGQPEDAAKFWEVADKHPHGALAAKYLHQVHSILLKFKPAEKKEVAAAFTASLKAPAPPREWMTLFQSQIEIDAEGWKFTGEQALKKKILAAIAGSAQPGCEIDSEMLLRVLTDCKEWPTLQKLAANLAKLYQRNPLFLLTEVVATLAQNKKTSSGTLTRKLYKAEDLIRLTPGSRHADLLPRIELLLNELNPMRSMFDSFFRPR